MQPQLLLLQLNPNDAVQTPEWCARDMVEWFKPTGRILEPCKGDGAFMRYLPGASWCEISEGIDFFAWANQVDWIISNPPYTDFKKWLEYSFILATDIVYLLPIHLFFRSESLIEMCYKYGWLKHIRIYGPGSMFGFPMSNPIGAMHFVRGYQGDTSWSWYEIRSVGAMVKDYQ